MAALRLRSSVMSLLQVITRAQVCRELNCHRDTIKRWIKKKGFPTPLPCVSREPIFDLNDVNEWIRNEGILSKQKKGVECD